MSRLVVCERTHRWAVAIRRAGAMRVHETRSLAECWRELSHHPSSFMALEITEQNVAEAVERLCRSGRDFPAARFAALADRSMTGCEWLIRQAGAIHFVDSRGSIRPLVKLVERHLARTAAKQEESWETSVWNRLPWG